MSSFLVRFLAGPALDLQVALLMSFSGVPGDPLSVHVLGIIWWWTGCLWLVECCWFFGWEARGSEELISGYCLEELDLGDCSCGVEFETGTEELGWGDAECCYFADFCVNSLDEELREA